jgi:hypothetical protein
MRIAKTVRRVALSALTVVGVLVAVWLAFVYSFGGGYFPGGPMHFPGDDNAAALAVTGVFLVAAGLIGGVYWLWIEQLSWRVSDATEARVDGVLLTVGGTALFMYPVLAIAALCVYLATG